MWLAQGWCRVGKKPGPRVRRTRPGCGKNKWVGGEQTKVGSEKKNAEARRVHKSEVRG